MITAHKVSNSELSKKNEIYYAIRQAIITREIQPGEILNEGTLGQQYGVSRTPVREALLMLTVEGLVSPLPRAGYMVTHITVRDVQEAFHLREVLELEAVRLAATQITAAELEALERVKIGDPIELNPVFNREFHSIIACASGNQRLTDLILQLIDEMERMLIYDPALSNPIMNEEHEDIITALRNHDAPAAQAAMRRHIEAVKARVLQWF